MPADKSEKLKYENAKWYEIYNKHRDKTMIQVSNRDFLLCRDIFIATVNIFILFLLLVSLGAFIFNVYFVIYLGIIAILSNVSARHKSERLVRNVITLGVNEIDK